MQNDSLFSISLMLQCDLIYIFLMLISSFSVVKSNSTWSEIFLQADVHILLSSRNNLETWLGFHSICIPWATNKMCTDSSELRDLCWSVNKLGFFSPTWFFGEKFFCNGEFPCLFNTTALRDYSIHLPLWCLGALYVFVLLPACFSKHLLQ